MKFVEYKEETFGKLMFGQLWEKLADELNKIGPPNRSVSEWRRYWRTSKFSKRKQSEKISGPSKKLKLGQREGQSQGNSQCF